MWARVLGRTGAHRPRHQLGEHGGVSGGRDPMLEVGGIQEVGNNAAAASPAAPTADWTRQLRERERLGERQVRPEHRPQLDRRGGGQVQKRSGVLQPLHEPDQTAEMRPPSLITLLERA